MKTVVFVFVLALMVLKANAGDIDRIFKGWFLEPHEFPWMVKLKVLFSTFIFCLTHFLFLEKFQFGLFLCRFLPSLFFVFVLKWQQAEFEWV